MTREAPYLYRDAAAKYNVFVPAVQHGSAGPTWSAGPTPGSSVSIESFFIAQPTDSVATINRQLGRGKNLILTPGVYQLDRTIVVSHPDTIVLGLGFPTLIPERGNLAMRVLEPERVLLSGMLFDAGPINSPALLVFGSEGQRSDHGGSNAAVSASIAGESGADNVSALHDVFFRIGGAAPGKATTSLIVNSDNVILDDLWGVACRPRQRRWVNRQHRRHRCHRQRRQRHRLRPLRGALPEVRGDLERGCRPGCLLPERDALRRAEPGSLDGGAGHRWLR